MERRDFLKAAAVAGLGLAFGAGSKTDLSNGGFGSRALAADAQQGVPDMVAVRNGEPANMFDRGIAAMGGMGRFVGRGQRVVVKPNVSWESTPEYAGNTNPELLARVIRHCLDAGASRVVVVDHTIENGQRCYEASGIGAASRDSGATIAPAEAERYYHSTGVPGGKSLKNVKVHEAILEADVFINVPILKHHGGAGMTAAMKNLMGAVWDRRYYHANNMQQCIADFVPVRTPDLNVVDCYRVLTRNGPRGGSLNDVNLARMQLLSTDIVAVDAASARILGRDPAGTAHIRLAHQAGLGQIDPGQLVTRRVTL